MRERRQGPKDAISGWAQAKKKMDNNVSITACRSLTITLRHFCDISWIPAQAGIQEMSPTAQIFRSGGSPQRKCVLQIALGLASGLIFIADTGNRHDDARVFDIGLYLFA